MLLDTIESWKRFANHHRSQAPFWCGGWGPFAYNCSMFLPTKISAISDLPKCVKILLCSPSSHHLIHVSFIPKASKPLRMNSKTVLRFSGDGASNRTESQTGKSASPNHSQPWRIVWNGISASEDPHKSSYKLLPSISDPTLEFSSSSGPVKSGFCADTTITAVNASTSHSHEKILERAHNKTK